MNNSRTQKVVSIVIPTLNASAELRIILTTLAEVPMVMEIIVADGGSSDGTAAIAYEAGAKVVSAPRGRGTQLAAGAAIASGDWLLFLHVDCHPAAGWRTAIDTFIGAPGAVGRAGYFRFALDDLDRAARRLERIVAWRCRALALPYGDQGLLIARTLYDEVGGFAAIPLMEDVDLVRRIGRRRLALIPATLYSSARRYRSGGYIRRPLRNLLCLCLFFAGVPPRHIARLYG